MTSTAASSLASLLKPRSVTVVGASATRPDATGNQVLRNLLTTGYGGRIELLSPSAAVIEGIQSVPSLAAIEPTDTAIVAVRAPAVSEVLNQLFDSGIGSAVVMSVGMGAADLVRLADDARERGALVHGPNCMGLINVHDGITMWADEGILTSLPSGNVALISQSGSGAIFVARSTTGVGFSYVVSTGNETVISTADYIAALADDSATDVIGIIIESVQDPAKLARAVSLAHAAGKSVVALKVGMSAAGALATIAHTGALLGDKEVARAFFSRIGVPLVEDYDELAASLDILSHAGKRPFGRARLAVATISGGQAALAGDIAEAVRVPFAALAPMTVLALEQLHPGATINNPVDAGASSAADEDAWIESLRTIAADPGVDVVMAVLDAQSTLSAVEIAYEDELHRDLLQLAQETDKPVVLASSSSLTIHANRIPQQGSPLPVLRGIRNAMVAVATAAAATQKRALPRPARPADLPDDAMLRSFRVRIGEAPGALPSGLVKELLNAYGISTVKSAFVASPQEAVDWAEDVGGQVVLKADSGDVPHRSDIGAVIVGLDGEEGIREAWATISNRVSAHFPHLSNQRMEIQEFIPGAIEAFAGSKRDDSFGAAVGVGLGGVLVELLSDVAHELAPLSVADSEAMLTRTRLGKLLSGFRNLFPEVDSTDLARVVSRLSWLASDLVEVVSESDLNPVLIDSSSGLVTVVDALVVSRPRR